MANTIQNKLAYLEETKEAIKQSIIAKGVEVTDTDTFRSYASKIEAIETGGSGTVNLPNGTKFGYSTFTTISGSIIPYLETQTDLGHMFANCTSLTTVPLFDTSNVTEMFYMFGSCYSLTSVPLFDTSKVENMNYMFYYCGSLQTVPAFNTANVNDMSFMFSYCQNLTTVPQFDASKVENMSKTFLGCSSLTNLGGFTNLKLDLDLRYSPKLIVDSVMNVINNAEDMTSSPKTLTLHPYVFNKLSQEQIATATAKGWNIAAS